MLGPAILGISRTVVLLTVFDALGLPARRDRLAALVRANERDVRVGFSGAAFLVNDGDLRRFAEQRFRVEFGFFGGGEGATEPFADELREGCLFVQRWGEAAGRMVFCWLSTRTSSRQSRSAFAG